MTFGGLALGVGMIVDAAIVVLENSFRHMEHHGKDRMTAVDRRQRGSLVGDPGVDPDAHRRVRAAALPRGHLEHPVPAAVGRRRLLAADVAVRRGHAGAGAVLAAARAAAAGRRAQRASAAGSTRSASGSSKAWTTATAGSCTWRWRTGRSSSASASRSVRRGGVDLPDAADRVRAADRRRPGAGRASSWRRARASSSPTPSAAPRGDDQPSWCPKPTDVIASAGRRRRRRRRRAAAARSNRGQHSAAAQAEGRAEALERSDRAWTCGASCRASPASSSAPTPSGGNNQLNRFLSGGNNGGGRLSLEIRGENLDDARKVAQAAKDLLDTVPGVADARLGRDDGAAGARGPRRPRRRRRCSA